MTNQPNHGDLITFQTVPAGSYASANVAYRVDRPKAKGDFRFVNVKTGSSTYDRPWAVARAVWSHAVSA